MRTDDDPIVVEERFEQDQSEVWKAITEVEKMRQWFFDNIPEFRPEVGFSTRFNVNSGQRDFMHLWNVVEVAPDQSIVVDWEYEGSRGKSRVSFELSKQGQSTLLAVSTRILEDFPQDVPEFTRESCIGGWQYFINERLKEFLSRT